jgi:hypothetical protein
MTAGTIDFYFWPDQATPTAPAPGQPSTSVNAEGFTFTSPSVYMAFSSLVASNRCGQVGDAWTSTTIGFDASEITTARPITTLTQYESDYVSDGSTYRMMGSAVTTQPPPKSVNFDEVGQNCSAISGYVYWPDNPINAANAMYRDDPCHPVILLPPRLISMQQPWIKASCGADPNLSGAYDPPRVLTPMLTATELATPTANWGGRVNGDGDASPASSAETGAPSTTTRPISTGVTAVYESAKPSPSAEDVSTATSTADAVTTAIVFSGQHVGTDSVTGMAGAILSGLGGGSGSSSGSDSEPVSESDSGSGSASASDAEESASKWNPTRAVDSSAIAASPAISPSNSGSGKKVSSSSSNNRDSSSASNTANGATSVAQAVATQSGAGAPATFATNSAIWSFLAPICLLWI